MALVSEQVCSARFDLDGCNALQWCVFRSMGGFRTDGIVDSDKAIPFSWRHCRSAKPLLEACFSTFFFLLLLLLPYSCLDEYAFLFCALGDRREKSIGITVYDTGFSGVKRTRGRRSTDRLFPTEEREREIEMCS